MGTIVHAVLITVPGNVFDGVVDVWVLRFAAEREVKMNMLERCEFPGPRGKVRRLALC